MWRSRGPQIFVWAAWTSLQAQLQKESCKETASLVKDSAYGGLDDEDVKVFKLSNYGFINALQKGRGGEEHANSPQSREIVACFGARRRSGRKEEQVQRLREGADGDGAVRFTRRLQFKWAETPADADISLREITERFVTGGMSLGALSRETHRKSGNGHEPPRCCLQQWRRR